MLTDLERTADALRWLPGIKLVTTGETFGWAADALFIVGTTPVDFDRIATLTEGIPSVDVMPVVIVEGDDPRFRERPVDACFLVDRYGKATIEQDEADFVEHFGLKQAPRNAMSGERIGFLMMSEADATRYDAVMSGEIEGEPVPERPVR